MKNFFTSESVTSGHPDKVCDNISDAILDAYLDGDKHSRVACECSVTTDFLLVMGEITSNATVDVEKVARQAIREIGYPEKGIGFNADDVKILIKLNKQSPDIALGVDNSQEAKDGGDAYDKIGAGDQGIMFGYACHETPELMPLPIMLSHKMCKKLEDVRKDGTLDYLRPDGKTQVTVEYDGDKALRVHTVVVSSQHSEDVTLEEIRAGIIENVIKPIIPENMIDDDTIIYVKSKG